MKHFEGERREAGLLFLFGKTTSTWDLSSLTRDRMCAPCRVLTKAPGRLFLQVVIHSVGTETNQYLGVPHLGDPFSEEP